MGETDALSAILKSAGAHVSSADAPDVVGEKYSEIGYNIRKAKREMKEVRDPAVRVESVQENLFWLNMGHLLSRGFKSA